MFMAIEKDDEIESGFWYLCLITQSKGQARRILTQKGKKPEDYIIFEIKGEK